MPAERPDLRDMPFVGRAHALDEVVAALTGERAAAVISGPAGVGKTRLAAEAVRALAPHGYDSVAITATPGASSLPLGVFGVPFPEAFRASEDLTSTLRRLLHTIGDAAGDAGDLVMVIDDAHLLDVASAALVHEAAARSTCAVLVTVRENAPTPEAITALWKDTVADRVDLEPLSRHDVADLLAPLLGHVAEATVQSLWETSAGNPLYLREILLASLTSGALTDHDGVWMLRSMWPTATRLSDVVSQHFADLSEATVAVVDLAAVGAPLPLDVLAELTPESALVDAEQRGLIRIDASARPCARVTQPIYAEVRRQQMGTVQYRRLCRDLASTLESRGEASPEDAILIALWRTEAGLPADPVALERAAANARSAFDLDVAARLAHASLDAGGGVAAALTLAETFLFAGKAAESEAILVEAARECTTDDELAHVANARAHNYGVLVGDREAANAIVEEALAIVTSPGPRHVLLYARATHLWLAGELRAAIDELAELVTSENHLIVEWSARITSMSLALLGRGDAAVEMAGRSLRAYRDRQVAYSNRAAHLIGTVIGRMGVGALSEAALDVRAGYEENARVESLEGQATFAMLLGWIHVERGDGGAAIPLFREGVILNREIGDTGTLRWCLGGLALAHTLTGDVAGATDDIDALDVIAPHWINVLDLDFTTRARAWVLAARGEETAARRALEDAAHVARDRDQRYAEARLLHDRARLDDPAAVVGRLAEVAATVEGDYVAALAADAAARDSARGSDLEDSARTLERIGTMGLAIDTLAVAARQYQAEGRSRAATACARRAAELAKGLGAAAGAVTAVPVTKLTRREREVALLAASGLASSDIGERLFISTRTVDNHLANAYVKLGVTGRRELAQVLDRQ